MPNMLAYGMLVLWPVITIFLFTQMDARKAIIWSIFAAYLLLPTRTHFNPPGFPNLDKTTIPNMATFLCAMLFAKQRLIRLPRSNVVLLLMVVFVISPIFTGMQNRAPIIMASTALPGMSLYDSLSACTYNAITLLPFILGYSALSRETDHLDILKILVVGVLAYSVLILYEIRFSPVLHGKIYGISAYNSFIQTIRFGGFRATVFIGHGLLVATLCAMAALAAATLWRMKIKTFTVAPGLVLLYLLGVLFFMKSVGSIVLTILVLPLLSWVRAQRMVSVMFVIASMILFYPAVRALDVFPSHKLTELAGKINEGRQQSLEFRFQNEERLLDRAAQKSWFGWGTYGRNQVFGTSTMNNTVAESVTDGTWIITIGQFGWVGYISAFGMLCYAFLRAFRLRKGLIPMATLGLLVVHLVNLMDLIPNSSLRPITWLIAGALSGLVFVPRAAAARAEALARRDEENRAHMSPA